MPLRKGQRRGQEELPVMVPRFPADFVQRPVASVFVPPWLHSGGQRFLNFMGQQPDTVTPPCAEQFFAVFIEQAKAGHAP